MKLSLSSNESLPFKKQHRTLMTQALAVSLSNLGALYHAQQQYETGRANL